MLCILLSKTFLRISRKTISINSQSFGMFISTSQRKLLQILLSVLFIFNTCNLQASDKVNDPYLSVVGIANTWDGLGRIALELVMSMQTEMRVELLPTENMPWKKKLPITVSKHIRNNKRASGKVVFYTDVLWLPFRSPGCYYEPLRPLENSNCIQIAYSMFESTKIPEEWVNILNNYFDAVAVPDKFLVDIYKSCGVQIPIFLVPMAIDLNKYLTVPIKKGRNHPLVFGNLGTVIDRKNHLTLIRAFIKAFGTNNSDVMLKLHSRFSSPETMEAVKAELDTLKATNIVFNDVCIIDKKYSKLLKSIDVLVNLSKGEGFSVQPREAMSLGIPTIITDNTAQHTICESGLVYSISSKIEEPALYFWKKPYYYGSYFNCDVDDVVKALIDVYNNYESYLSKGPEAREWARKYDIDQLKPLYKNFIKPAKIILGDKDLVTQEYVMTTSQKLYDKWEGILNSSNTEND